MDVAVLQQFAIGQPVFLQNKNSVIWTVQYGLNIWALEFIISTAVVWYNIQSANLGYECY